MHSIGLLLTCLGCLALLAVPVAALSDYVARRMYGGEL